MFEKVRGFPNYEVDELGNVYGIVRRKLVKPIIDRNGYATVYLYRNRKRHFCLVHRIVAEQFVPNPQNKRTVNHKDGDKTNNCIDNLEWATDSENVKHAYTTGLNKRRCGVENSFYGKKHSAQSIAKMSNAKKGKPSLRRKPCVIDGVRYDSVSEALTKTGLSTRAIYKKTKGE